MDGILVRRIRLLIVTLFICNNICQCERSWHLFRDDHQSPERHPPFVSKYAQFIRDMWDIPSRNISSPSYRELEFDRAIDIIYKHQHPQDCSTAKFLVSKNGYPATGFGSEMHMEGYFLYLAMETNRIYIPYSMHPHHNRFDRQRPEEDVCYGTNSFFECFFQPLTNCTWNDVSKHIPPGTWNSVDYKNFIDDHGSWQDAQVIITDMRRRDESHEQNVPSKLLPLLEVERITGGAYYWWRGIAAVYMTVPSDRTRKLIKELGIQEARKLDGKCVSMYVRWADKAAEMKLHQWTEYINMAEKLWDLTYPNDKSIQRTIVYGTETKEVAETQIEWTNNQKKWTVLYNPMQLQLFKGVNHFIDSPSLNKEYERFPHLLTQQKLKTMFGGSHSFGFLIVILNLADFMRCDSFVCTLGSNSCRIIDELRALVAAKPYAYFADLSGETCRNPPCYGDNRDFINFNW